MFLPLLAVSCSARKDEIDFTVVVGGLERPCVIEWVVVVGGGGLGNYVLIDITEIGSELLDRSS